MRNKCIIGKDHLPDEMSGGQQQRVAIACAPANTLQLILAGELTGELGSATRREILSHFHRIVEGEQGTLLIALYDALVDELAVEVLQLKDGQIVWQV